MMDTETLHKLKNSKIIFLAVLLTKFYVLMINLANQLLFIEEKMKSINLLKQNAYCKKVTKKHFNKNLAILLEVERRFQSSNKCWVCNK